MTEHIASINPSTLKPIDNVDVTTKEELLEIVQKARKAQKAWEAIGFDGRKPFFNRLSSYLLDHYEEVARFISQENGKPYLEAILAEVYPSIDVVNFYSKRAKKLLSDKKIPIRIFKFMGKKSYIMYKSVGVIGIISPWNYPFAIPFSEIIMALVAGNTVILKPSELTPLIGKKIKELLDTAGFPDGVFSIVYGDGKIGAELVKADLSKIIFTGSVATGRRIMAAAAENLIPVVLELGGKDPMIVLKDADLDMSARGAVWSGFMNSGQTCASVERVYVDESIKDRFVELVIKHTGEIRQGDKLENESTDMGPMIDHRQLSIVENHVKDAESKGAKVLTGGNRPTNLNGYFYKPTVLVNVDHSMQIMTEETFGPVLPIMGFKTEEDAIKLANDSRYALTASVWSKDIKRAEAIARQLVAGTVTINDHIMTYGIPETPWGGSKESGFGRTHSDIGLMEFVEPIHIHVDRAWIKKKPWWYPYDRKTLLFLKVMIWFTKRAKFLVS
ncbi:MAG: aldehyde dehydrogenase family protein [Deltaproteobacteria bacterium]|nr:aldehyde dehydrogenase family protein [Deltaproteobacteria bacterium]MCL5791975.1 aldehyde dehydrogenase family protein [Deltaproteobacteria bacterium]